MISGTFLESLFHQWHNVWHNRGMDLNELLIFAKVIQTGSFSLASQLLGIPKSTVSRKILELEERLGTRLIQRTTRKLSLTDVGRLYYAHCARIVAEVEEAERAVSSLQQSPRGVLRVTAPVNISFLGPILADFLQQFPEVQLDLVCTDRVVNLVEEGFDVGIRAGLLADSGLMARRLGSLQRYLVASPAYVSRRGAPETPQALTRHDCLVFGVGNERLSWPLMREGRTEGIEITPRLVVNDLEVLHEAAVAGLGIALLPATRCTGDFQQERLMQLLPGWHLPETPVHAVYPSNRHLSSKVKAFVDHLQRHFLPPPRLLELAD